MLARNDNARRRLARATLILALALIAIAPLSACTAAPTPLPTATASPTATATFTPTPTPMPTATATAIPTATPPPLQVSVHSSDAAATQGAAWQIDVRCNQPCGVTADWGDRTIPLIAPAPDRAWAAIGVHALAEPLTQTLLVTATTAGGQSVSLKSPLPIVTGDFESETIPLTTEKQALLAPAIADAENARMNALFAAFTPRLLWDGPFAWPWNGPVTSLFGTRRDYQGVVQGYHTGIDLDGETGDPISACGGGEVVLAETLQVRGNAVVIDHGAGVMSGYYHLDQIDVALGDTVAPGDQLGLMGSTGLSTGSHLHWEVRVGGVAVSPAQWTEQMIGPSMEPESQ